MRTPSALESSVLSEGFAHVVYEAGAFGYGDVFSDFGGHDSGEVCDFLGVPEYVLAV